MTLGLFETGALTAHVSKLFFFSSCLLWALMVLTPCAEVVRSFRGGGRGSHDRQQSYEAQAGLVPVTLVEATVGDGKVHTLW